TSINGRLGEAISCAVDCLVQQRDDALAQRDALSARVKALEEALRPFAAFAQTVEQFVDDRARDGGSAIMPTNHFRLADFQRAAVALTSPNPSAEKGGD